MATWMKRFGKLAVVVTFAAMFACMSAGMAWADDGADADYNPDTEILTVEWTDASGFHTKPVTEGMVASKIKATTQGYLYQKDGIWHVLGTNRWVELDDFLEAAGATSFLTSSTKITLWVYDDKDPSTAVKYEKYTPFYDEMSSKAYPLWFFYDTTRTGDLEYRFYDFTNTCIALNCGSEEIAEDEYAYETLDNMTMSTKRAPRLLWGLDEYSTEFGGQRFPSNIAKIVLTN